MKVLVAFWIDYAENFRSEEISIQTIALTFYEGRLSSLSSRYFVCFAFSALFYSAPAFITFKNDFDRKEKHEK